MKYPAYPKYKPSGVEWLGEVPEHWEVKRLKFILSEPLKYGANESAEIDDPELPRYIRITDIDENGSLRNDTFRSLPREVAAPFLLQDGDLLFARSGATSGKSFLYKKDWGVCAYAGYLIRVRLNQSKAVPPFVRYFTSSISYWQWLSSIYIQATIQNVSAEKYADLQIPLPPLPEQRAIADFLDRETAKLDTLVAKKRELIEKLKEKRTALISRTVTRGLPPEAARAAGLNPNPKLKPSGIEWLGEVPEHWEVSKIKFEATVVSKGTTPSTIGKELNDEGIRFIKAENIQDGRVLHFPEFFIDAETDQLLTRSRLKEHDVLIVIAGATTGKSAVLPVAFVPSNTNQAVCFIRLKNKIYAPILSAWISTKFVQDIIWNSAVQAAQPNLAMEDIKTIPCLIPPIAEQRALADYLDRETAKIDQMAAKVEEALARLQEYRTALITAAVTGKIEVRKESREAGLEQRI